MAYVGIQGQHVYTEIDTQLDINRQIWITVKYGLTRTFDRYGCTRTIVRYGCTRTIVRYALIRAIVIYGLTSCPQKTYTLHMK